MSNADPLFKLVGAVAALDPQPRQRLWRSLSFCIVDSVFSIGARYSTVIRTVNDVASHCGIDRPSIPVTPTPGPDPLPLGAFLQWFGAGENLAMAGRNRQRTSTRGGILKAQAAITYAEILHQAGVLTLTDAQKLLGDPDRFDTVNDQLKGVPGEGQSGVRRGYLWMLVGADDLIKPDRMVLRWLAQQGHSVNTHDARTLLATVAAAVSTELDRPVTPWEIDHAIWQDARR